MPPECLSKMAPDCSLRLLRLPPRAWRGGMSPGPSPSQALRSCCHPLLPDPSADRVVCSTPGECAARALHRGAPSSCAPSRNGPQIIDQTRLNLTPQRQIWGRQTACSRWQACWRQHAAGASANLPLHRMVCPEALEPPPVSMKALDTLLSRAVAAEIPADPSRARGQRKQR